MYKVRFEFLVSTRFEIEDTSYSFDLAGRPAILKAFPEGPLKEAQCVRLEIEGFPTEAGGAEFGAQLKHAAVLACTKTGFGMDVGDDTARSTLGAPYRHKILEEHGVDVRPRIHGIDVFRADIPTETLVVSMVGLVSTKPNRLFDEVEKGLATWGAGVDRDLAHALRLRAEANFSGDTLARMVLAIAAVEALTPDEHWTEPQNKLLEHLADSATGFPEASTEEISEVVERIRKQRRLGVNQGFRRLFARLSIEPLWSRWSKLYSIRSQVLHGEVPIADARAAIDEALVLSRFIVLKAAGRVILGADDILTSEPTLY